MSKAPYVSISTPAAAATAGRAENQEDWELASESEEEGEEEEWHDNEDQHEQQHDDEPSPVVKYVNYLNNHDLSKLKDNYMVAFMSCHSTMLWDGWMDG